MKTLPKSAILWFRNDLRLQDNPALAAATEAEHIVPVFILDETLLRRSPTRARFLVECLADLRQQLRACGADLIIRRGRPEVELLRLAREAKAATVHASADYSPYALARDKRVARALRAAGVAYCEHPGRLIVDDPATILTGADKPYQVFTPFYKKWLTTNRRKVVSTPRKLQLPPGLTIGSLPKPPEGGAQHTVRGGSVAGEKQLKTWLEHGLKNYADQHDDMGADGTSHLSAYLHFGCLSPRLIEERLPANTAATAFRGQLAWRDFYLYILFHFPANAHVEFQERYRGMHWQTDKTALQAWQRGQTGYPIVDAAMRQLHREGFMHNRGRLIVGSFLTKDLGLDWRLGEAHFMEWLVDGDKAVNNGNWQWIASVGVDPAPLFRRLYNPVSQQQRYDPHGDYVRRYVPELAKVPDQYLAEPWTMPLEVQKQAGCKIGHDYPAPIIDHAVARQAALERYARQR